jgi:c-di-GMP-binding flagellar brake protein YcgR
LLGEEQMLNGRIFDLSVHGAYLRDEDGRMFQPGEQLRLRIPLGKSAPLADGEYLKLSARVRRIFMVGSEAGVSFEHTTEEKSLALTKLITSLANVQNMRRG